MIPYIVFGSIHRMHYMGETEVFEDFRIVMAENETEANEKYQDFWDKKSQDYGVSYAAYGEVRETIL
jgi:translation initiation factor 2 alpha subunit (eIF-2alpha)